MTNAKDELLFHISNRAILCAKIELNNQPIILTTGWTQEDWKLFLNQLDLTYDSGWGSQELFGTIWYVDGTWSERAEYDGSEWWEYRKCPNIPTELNRVDKTRDKKLNQIL